MKKSRYFLLIPIISLSLFACLLLYFLISVFNNPSFLDINNKTTSFNSESSKSDKIELNEEDTNKANDSNVEDTKNPTETNKPLESSNPAEADKIEVDKKLFGNVEITIPKSIAEMMKEDDKPLELTEEQKNYGFKDIKNNSDGSITFTIANSKYKDYINELRQITADVFDNMLIGEQGFKTIKKIEYNKNFSEITLIVNKEEYNNSFESMAVFSCGLSSMLYQTFDVNAPQKAVITVKDIDTNETISQTVYPDALNDMSE